jgi:hypothetical protein
MHELNWKLKEKIGVTCGQPSTCSNDKLEILVTPPTDIHPAAIDQNWTGIFSKSKAR